jgi:hypothetical protein
MNFQTGPGGLVLSGVQTSVAMLSLSWSIPADLPKSIPAQQNNAELLVCSYANDNGFISCFYYPVHLTLFPSFHKLNSVTDLCRSPTLWKGALTMLMITTRSITSSLQSYAPSTVQFIDTCSTYATSTAIWYDCFLQVIVKAQTLISLYTPPANQECTLTTVST